MYKIGAALLLSLSMASTSLWAKPVIEPLGANIADTQSQYYDFKIKKFISKDKKRHYKVWLAIPKNNSNSAKAALFMLDGNAVMDRLKESDLAALSQKDAPVLVAIGYDTNLPFLSAARSIDYTPNDGSGKIQPDPRATDRLSGGSHEFRQLVTTEIAAWVTSQVKLDAKRTGLWGHSYGGLFVLDSLLDSQYFSHYFAASPSLMWADKRMLHKIKNQAVSNSQHKKLWLIEGDVEPSTQRSSNYNPNTVADLNHVARHVQKQGTQTQVLLYPNKTHGELFNLALAYVLQQNLLN